MYRGYRITFSSYCVPRGNPEAPGRSKAGSRCSCRWAVDVDITGGGASNPEGLSEPGASGDVRPRGCKGTEVPCRCSCIRTEGSGGTDTAPPSRGVGGDPYLPAGPDGGARECWWCVRRQSLSPPARGAFGAEQQLLTSERFRTGSRHHNAKIGRVRSCSAPSRPGGPAAGKRSGAQRSPSSGVGRTPGRHVGRAQGVRGAGRLVIRAWRVRAPGGGPGSGGTNLGGKLGGRRSSYLAEPVAYRAVQGGTVFHQGGGPSGAQARKLGESGGSGRHSQRASGTTETGRGNVPPRARRMRT